jgi:hypothetical protein
VATDESTKPALVLSYMETIPDEIVTPFADAVSIPPVVVKVDRRAPLDRWRLSSSTGAAPSPAARPRSSWAWSASTSSSTPLVSASPLRHDR